MSRYRDYYLPGEAADCLGVGVRQVQRWADAGLLPHSLTPSGRRRYDRWDVEHFARPPVPRRLRLQLPTSRGLLVLRTVVLNAEDADAVEAAVEDAQRILDAVLVARRAAQRTRRGEAA